MSYSISKVNGSLIAMSLFSGIISMAISFLPHYSKGIYEKEEVVQYNKYSLEDQSGYPVDDDYPVVNSVEEIVNNTNFTIEVNKSDLQPTGYYLDISSKNFCDIDKSKFFSFICEEDYGQLYKVRIGSDETILILINDFEVDLKKEGILSLPAGKYEECNRAEQYEEIWEQQNLEEYARGWYVDMTTGWYNNIGYKKISDFRGNMFTALWIFQLIIGASAYLVYIFVYRKR